MHFYLQTHLSIVTTELYSRTEAHNKLNWLHHYMNGRGVVAATTARVSSLSSQCSKVTIVHVCRIKILLLILIQCINAMSDNARSFILDAMSFVWVVHSEFHRIRSEHCHNCVLKEIKVHILYVNNNERYM